MKLTKNSETGKKLNSWIVILLAAPLPLVIFGLWFFKWSSSRTHYSHLTSQLLNRQNKVLMQDGVTVAREFSHLLESASRDVQTLSLVPVNARNFTRFYLSRILQVAQF